MMSQILLPSTGKGQNGRRSTSRDRKNGASSGMFTAEATTTTLNNEDGIAFSLAAKDQEKEIKRIFSLNPKYQKSSKKRQRIW